MTSFFKQCILQKLNLGSCPYQREAVSVFFFILKVKEAIDLRARTYTQCLDNMD